MANSLKLIDRFGRKIDYLRVSITDRCDFRCEYCMAEKMEFLPRSHILSLEEIATLVKAFVELGVQKVRVTGGEPLIRQGVLGLLTNLGKISGLNELTLTTNASHLAEMAPAIKQAGVRRINISLDSLNPEKFHKITRSGSLARVLEGIEVARSCGFEKIKLNVVILKNRNDEEVCELVRFAVEKQLDISFIEEMPLGHLSSHIRAETFYPSYQIRQDLATQFQLIPSMLQTGGPSNYYQLAHSSTRVGFISPHSENFCASCNRVRLTAEGRLLLCLGNEHSVDLKKIIRAESGNTAILKQAIVDAMAIKPERHEFNIHEQPVIFRHMNATGG